LKNRASKDGGEPGRETKVVILKAENPYTRCYVRVKEDREKKVRLRLKEIERGKEKKGRKGHKKTLQHEGSLKW